jgi:predicted ATPase
VFLSFQGGKNWYRLSLATTDDDTLYPSRETAAYGGSRLSPATPAVRRLAPRDHGREAGISDPDAQHRVDQPIAQWVWRRLGLWGVYHMIDTSPGSLMRKTAKLNDNQFLKSDGSNLPAFLYLLQRKFPESYRLVRAIVQRVAPFFDDFLLQPDPLNEDTIRLAWKHKASDQYFGASALSDGSLRFIALATLLLQPTNLRPSVILIDEPELGLHPYAITLLASLVKQASIETQVVLSTQSSLLLDHFQPEDVLVAERVNDGTQLTRLEPTHLVEWLQDYSLGQLWEKNEFGGRPGSE